MHLIDDDYGSNESMEQLLARATQLVNASQSKIDPRYLAHMEDIYRNTLTYPYKDGKKELGEYIGLWKSDQNNAATIRRFIQLGRKLRKYHIIPNDIVDHAAELAEENARKRKAMEEREKPRRQNAIIETVGARNKALAALHH